MLVSVGGSPDQYDNAQVSSHHADEDGEDGDDDVGDEGDGDDDNGKCNVRFILRKVGG